MLSTAAAPKIFPATMIVGLPSLLLYSSPRLTVHESLVLEEALKKGYFDWPQKINLKQLAEILGTSPSTVLENIRLEHIRKAESKILRYYFLRGGKRR